jgi:acyl carrier protein
LEIGAGTGGTTAHLLAAFSQGSSDPSTYVYTDKSKRFVEHGLDRFGKSYAYVEGQCLDIESEPKDQGFAPASFDVIVAANVLHATRNMRTTLAHVRSLLKPGGLLVLNELSDNALYAHVTFGLLDGWWTYDDPELRLEGSPGLSAENWRNLLEETGFSALEYPASQHHGLGQQIITAQAWPAIFSDMEHNISDLNALENNIRNHVSQALKIDPSKIEKDRSFADYGVDSILAVNLVNDIADAVDMPLTTTVIFDYNNVSKLARHLHESSGEVKPAVADRSETEKESTNTLKRSSKEGLLGEVVRALDSLAL